jgi:hypothetical protein
MFPCWVPVPNHLTIPFFLANLHPQHPEQPFHFSTLSNNFSLCLPHSSPLTAINLLFVYPLIMLKPSADLIILIVATVFIYLPVTSAFNYNVSKKSHPCPIVLPIPPLASSLHPISCTTPGSHLFTNPINHQIAEAWFFHFFHNFYYPPKQY